jgi:pimeloyl-ACP methyl ester carboxylesterase
MPEARNGEARIYYEVFGGLSGPVVLLVNGLGSQCTAFATEFCDMLVDAGCGVIRFDNRDVGRSTKFDHATTNPPYTFADMALDAVAVLDAADVRRAHAVGVSMGGQIVQQLAIDHLQRLTSLTSVMSTTGDPDVGRPTAEAISVLLRPAPSDRDGFISQYLEALRVYGSPDQFDPTYLAAVAGEAYDRCFCPAGRTRQAAAAAAAVSRSPALAGVRLPALVLHGDRDPLIDISGGRRTAEAIPNARFEVIEGMGHDLPPAYWPSIARLIAAHALAAEQRR